jgi:hypothetical protein
MSGKSKMRWIRVLGFATIYFFIYVISAVFFIIKSHVGSSELTWYLQHPWIALRTIFDELTRSPLLMFLLLIMIISSFILGFVTDWVLHISETNKVQRGWKKEETPLKNGQMLYYNFIRQHMTLEGKTPAEKAGLNVTDGQNKWMELLKWALSAK